MLNLKPGNEASVTIKFVVALTTAFFTQKDPNRS